MSVIYSDSMDYVDEGDYSETRIYDTVWWGVRLNLPIGLEAKITENLFFRLGANPYWAFGRHDLTINDTTELEQSAGDMNTSYTAGFGYSLFDRLNIDISSNGDLSNMRSWRMALQYLF